MKRKINLLGWVALFLVFAIGSIFVYGIFLFWSMFFIHILLESGNFINSVFEAICLILLWGFGCIYFVLRGFNWFINLTNIRNIKLYKEKKK